MGPQADIFLVEVFQEVVTSVFDTDQDRFLTTYMFWQQGLLNLRQIAVFVRNRVSVGISAGMAQKGIEFFDKQRLVDVFELFGDVMYLVPAKVECLDQKHFP